MGATPELAKLVEQPFELLAEIERRSREAHSGPGAGAMPAEWVGVGFRIGEEHFVANRDQVREVLMLPEGMTRVPGAKPWVSGLANVRGHLLPLVDLRAFLGAGTGGGGRSSRVLVLNSNELPVGLIVDEVFGFRRFFGVIMTSSPKSFYGMTDTL